MTREEMIENLKGLLESNYVDSFDDAENEALDMAIKALSQEPCPYCGAEMRGAIGMTREVTVKELVTELIDMIDNGSQRDLDRADEIGTSIIKLFEQIRAEIDQIDIFMGRFDYPFIPKKLVLYIIDKYKGDKE